MTQRTLIIFGSPHKDGNTAALVDALKETLSGEVVEISAWYANISPCLDCRRCWETAQCALRDDMDLAYADDYDNIVLASPVHYGTLPGKVLSLASRLQTRRGKHLSRSGAKMSEKKAALILTAGGRNDSDTALHHARCVFKMMGARGFEERSVTSMRTDDISATADEAALARAREIGRLLSDI
ncbi:MAG: flavodoxin family protein [Eggerthellaceae bacterium]|nr:flavodoxin family protein [Eggerthellaceae bacterium]